MSFRCLILKDGLGWWIYVREEFEKFLAACGVPHTNPYPYVDMVNNVVIAKDKSYPIPEGVQPPHLFPIAGFRAEDRMELLHAKAQKQEAQFIDTINALEFWGEVFDQT